MSLLPARPFLAVCLWAALCAPASGSEYLDPDFGVDGVVPFNLRTATSPGAGYHSAWQDDGRLVTVGSITANDQQDWAIYRLRADGQLDSTFSGDGRLRLDHLGFDDVARRVAIDESGRILVAGTVQTEALLGQDWAVVRLLSDGTIDTTFADEGWRILDHGYHTEELVALAIDSGGRAVLGGRSRIAGDPRLVFARLLPDGELDSGFGTGGVSTVSLDDEDFNAHESLMGIAIDSQDRVLFGGDRGGEAPFIGTALVGASVAGRLRTDGTLDPTFGTGGILEFQAAYSTTSSSWGDVRVLDDDSMLWTGISWFRKYAGESQVLTIVRITPDGTLAGSAADDDLDDSMTTVTFSGTSSLWSSGLVPLPDGKLLAVAALSFSSNGGLDTGIGLARLQADGSLDPSFGSNGSMVIDGPADKRFGNAVAHVHNGTTRIAITATAAASDQALVTMIDADGSVQDDFAGGRREIGMPVRSIDTIVGGQALDEERLLVWGSSEIGGVVRPVVAQVFRDGRLDRTFAGTGVWWSSELTGPVSDLLRLSDGRLLLALRGQGDSNGWEAQLLRLQDNGNLDTTFAEDGIARFAHDEQIQFRSLLRTSGGRILVGGSLFNSRGDGDLMIRAYRGDGQVDTAWQEDGLWLLDDDDSPFAVEYVADLIEHGGRLWLGGRSMTDRYLDSIVMALDLAGNPVTAFADDGKWKVSVSPAQRSDAVQSLLGLDGGGVLAVGGYTTAAQTGGMFAARFDTNGLDTGFGDAGIRRADIDPERADVATAVVAHENGFLIAGSAEDYTEDPRFRPVLMRLTADGSFDPDFGDAGRMLIERPDFTHLSGLVLGEQHAWLLGDDGADATIARLQLAPVSGNPPVIDQGASTMVSMDEDGNPVAFDLTLSATDADGDDLVWSIVQVPDHGSAAVSPTPTGNQQSIDYQPDADYHGSDQFVVQVSDGLLSDAITVTVSIAAQPDDPSGTPTLQVHYNGMNVSSGESLAGPNLQAEGDVRLFTLTLSNPGTANLVNDSTLITAISGAQVRTTTALPTALAPGQEAHLQLALNASAAGTYAFEVRLPHNAGGANPFIVQVAGDISAAPLVPRTVNILVEDGDGAIQVQPNSEPVGLDIDAAGSGWRIVQPDRRAPTRVGFDPVVVN